MIRKPAVAGQFYPGTEASLKKELARLIPKNITVKNAFGVMLPHAGYVYSGQVAGATLSSVNISEDIIILGPNHTGYGKPFSIMSDGAWSTPLGEAKINNELAKTILDKSDLVEEDATAHIYEHSIEVELPLIQYLKNSFSFVPIAIAGADIEDYKRLGNQLSCAVSEFNKDVLLIASSDMTHYEPHDAAEKKDSMAINSILKLDIDELMGNLTKYDISMCGYAPVCVMLACAKKLGATAGKLIKYQTSGDVSGDKSSVVGYAGIVIY